MRGHSLRRRIILWSFVPTSIILAAVAFVNFYSYQQITESLVLARDGELARLLAQQVSTELDAYVDQLNWVARSPEIGSDIDADPTVALNRTWARLVSFDGGTLLFDADGVAIAAIPERAEVLGEDWSDVTYIEQALRFGQPVFSDVVSDGPGGLDVVVVAVPVTTDAGARVGVLAGMLLVQRQAGSTLYGGIARGVERNPILAEELLYVSPGGSVREAEDMGALSGILLQPRLTRMRLGGESAFLVDASGRVIYHSDPREIGRDLSGLASVESALQRHSGAARMTNADGMEIVAAFAPVSSTRWALVTEETWDALIAPWEGYKRFLIALLIAGVAVPGLLVLWQMGRLTRPITALTWATREVAAGRFGHTLEIETGDELEELAQRFNQMSQQLQESYSTLERRVADRTHELETMNAIVVAASQSLDLEETVSEALALTRAHFGLETGEVFLLDAEETTLELAVRQGTLGAGWVARDRIPVRGTVEGTVLESQEPVVRPWPKETGADTEESAACAIVPLATKSRPLGIMTLGCSDPAAFAPEDLALLASIGGQVAVAVDNARLYEQAEETAALAERNRLARDLHDSVTQTLYGVTLYAKAAARLLSEGDAALAAEHLLQVERAAQDALQEMRLLIFELRPYVLQQDGLEAALRARLEAVEQRSGLTTSLTVAVKADLEPQVEEALYRIAQEALNNVLKHAQAAHVAVRLVERPDMVVLEITDDGVGFDPKSAAHQGGLGLRNMTERVARLDGKLAIVSALAKGTRITAEVPR